MTTIVYPGSFDPITMGHMDLIQRASRMTDHLIVAVLNNTSKKRFFTTEERVQMIRQCVKRYSNVTVDSSEGLLINYMHSVNANIILRGLRAVSDFEMELQWAMLNQKLDDTIEAIYLMTSPDNSFLSSSMVREIGAFGGDISSMVPPEIACFVKEKLLNHTKGKI